jgi:hypothetical protein
MLFQRSENIDALLSATAFLVTIAVVLFASVGTAVAQEEDPLKLVFLNSDPMDGEGVYDSVEGVLEASNDIELFDPADLLTAGDERGVSLETFRDGDRRKQNAGAFKDMLAQTSAESIMVLDVFGSGNTMQLVIIGPRGDELADVRQSIAGSTPSQAESVEALREVFKVLVPEIRDFREAEARRKEQNAQVDLLGEGEPEELTVKERVIKQHRQNHAELTVGVTPTAGMIFGRRNMQVETQAEYQLDHASPFIGFGGEIDAIFMLMDGETAAIGATLFGGYAPFTTVFTDPNTGEPSEYPSAYSNVRLDLKYLKGLGRDLIVHGKLGAEMMTVSVGENELYTGNSYLNLRVGAGLLYQFGQLAELHLDAAALPTLSAELSGDAMGKNDFGVGFHGAGRLHLKVLEPVDVSIGYDLQYYAVTFSSPNLEDLGGEALSTSDVVHLANVMIGYGF